MYEVFFFETERKIRPVEEFILKQNKETGSKIAKEVRLLKTYGHYLQMPHVRQLNREIFELRIRGKNEIRILYVFTRNAIYLLHAFKKQTQQTPNKEIEIALKRSKLLT